MDDHKENDEGDETEIGNPLEDSTGGLPSFTTPQVQKNGNKFAKSKILLSKNLPIGRIRYKVRRTLKSFL